VRIQLNLNHVYESMLIKKYFAFFMNIFKTFVLLKYIPPNIMKYYLIIHLIYIILILTIHSKSPRITFFFIGLLKYPEQIEICSKKGRN
jgi:hypothetical protein